MNVSKFDILEREFEQHFEMSKKFETGFHQIPKHGQIYITLAMLFVIQYSSKKTITIGYIKSDETQLGLVKYDSPDFPENQFAGPVEIQLDETSSILGELRHFDLAHEDGSISTRPESYYIDSLIYSGRMVSQIRYRGEHETLSSKSHINLYKALLQMSREIVYGSDNSKLKAFFTQYLW